MELEVPAYFLMRLCGTVLTYTLNLVFFFIFPCWIFVFKRNEPSFFASLEGVTSVAATDRIPRLVSVQALIDTGILSLIDLFLIEILLVGAWISCPEIRWAYSGRIHSLLEFRSWCYTGQECNMYTQLCLLDISSNLTETVKRHHASNSDCSV